MAIDEPLIDDKVQKETMWGALQLCSVFIEVVHCNTLNDVVYIVRKVVIAELISRS